VQGKFAQQQGKWEIHAQLPDPTAQCSWPAHWLLPDARPSCWPIGGEVDIMEQVTGFKKNAVFGP
jgi:beta-glucanase (GH16 family)